MRAGLVHRTLKIDSAHRARKVYVGLAEDLNLAAERPKKRGAGVDRVPVFTFLSLLKAQTNDTLARSHAVIVGIIHGADMAMLLMPMSPPMSGSFINMHVGKSGFVHSEASSHVCIPGSIVMPCRPRAKSFHSKKISFPAFFRGMSTTSARSPGPSTISPGS